MYLAKGLCLFAAGVFCCLWSVGCSIIPGETGADDSPLAPYRALLEADPDAHTISAQSDEQEAQELIASCMAANGFSYTPYLGGMATLNAESDPFFEGLGTPEWAAEHGYGFTHMLVEDRRGQTTPPMADPNQAIRESFSEAELEAYQLTLHGSADAVAAGGDKAGEQGSADLGCADEAYQTVADRRAEQTGSFAEFQYLRDEYATLVDRLHQQPDVVAAERDWAECLAGEGFPGVETSADTRLLLYAEHERLLAVTDKGVDELSVLADYERQLAVADLGCATDVALESTMETALNRLETEFYSKYRNSLEQFLVQHDRG